MAASAPSAARRWAIAAPMPREPPVISAIFPSRFLDIVFLLSLSTSLESDRGAAAIDGDDRPGDVAGAGRGQECHDLGNFCGLGGAVEWSGGPKGVEQLACRRSRVHRTRCNGVHPDPAWAELSGPPLRQGDQGGLGGTVSRTAGQA